MITGRGSPVANLSSRDLVGAAPPTTPNPSPPTTTGTGSTSGTTGSTGGTTTTGTGTTGGTTTTNPPPVRGGGFPVWYWPPGFGWNFGGGLFGWNLGGWTAGGYRVPVWFGFLDTSARIDDAGPESDQ